MIAVARGATHASHGWPLKATQGLRGAGTAQRNAHIEQISAIGAPHPFGAALRALSVFFVSLSKVSDGTRRDFW